jgi:hypothetical protein
MRRLLIGRNIAKMSLVLAFQCEACGLPLPSNRLEDCDPQMGATSGLNLTSKTRLS